MVSIKVEYEKCESSFHGPPSYLQNELIVASISLATAYAKLNKVSLETASLMLMQAVNKWGNQIDVQEDNS